MANPFWNREQRRARTLWRLVLQVLLFLVLQVGLGMLLGLVGMLWVSAQPGGAAQLRSNPTAAITLLRGAPLFSLLSLLAILGAMVLSVWLAGRFLDRRRFSDFGFHFSRSWWLDFGFGLGLGAVLMVIIFLVELAAGWVQVTGTFVSTGFGFAPTIALAVAQFIAVGIQEELFSRGYQLHNLAEGLNIKGLGARGAVLVAWVITSAIFASLHLANPNASAVSTIFLVAAGLFLGLGFILTGELAIPIGIHITWNFFQGNVFGFPVSGTPHGASFIATAQKGPVLVTGGAFGPEAGLMGLAAIVLGSFLTVLWVRRRQGQATVCDRLAEYPVPAPAEPL